MKEFQHGSAAEGSILLDRLKTASIPARKLFAVIVREAFHGPIHPKAKGTATPPEILEACGLDVGEFYLLLEELKTAGLIKVSNAYPFEEITLAAHSSDAETLAERCTNAKIALEEVFVDLVSPFDRQG
jgi:hypothetical protein